MSNPMILNDDIAADDLLYKPYIIENDFGASAFRSSLESEPNMRRIDFTLFTIVNIDDDYLKAHSLYYFSKIIYDKYLYNSNTELLETCLDSLSCFIDCLEDCIFTKSLYINQNDVLESILNKLSNDVETLERLLTISAVDIDFKTLGFHFYNVINCYKVKQKYKESIIKSLNGSVNLSVDFSSFDKSVKESFFNEYNRKFIEKYL